LQEFIDRLVTERAPIWRRLGALPATSGDPRPDEPVL
jgi:hypothetical protein